MKKQIFNGCGTAIVTPFNENGVDFESYGKLIDYQIENGVSAIITCGTTGEAATMTSEEKTAVISYTIEKVAKRVPVIVGTGSNNTEAAITSSKEAEALGADGLLVVTPYYNKCTQAGLVKHYTKIANSTNLPIIVYSVKSRTGVNIEPKTAYELSKVSNIVAIKEASGDLSQIAKIKALCGDNLDVYSGNDDQVAAIYAVGGIGVISVLSNVLPKETSTMCKLFSEDNFKEGSKMQLKYIELISSLFCEVNPIPVKYALSQIGYNVGTPRLPLTEITEEGKEKVNRALKNLNLI